MSLKTALLTVTAALVVTLVYGQTVEDGVGNNCLGCMCEAASQCNATSGCFTPYAGAYFCGPFHISWAYWADAGKPVIKNDNPDRKGAFENCVEDLYCAAETVRLYMRKFGTDPGKSDCNNDGIVDCRDYAYMHILGGYNCKDPAMANTTFIKRFETCWKVVQAATPKKFSSVSLAKEV